MTLQKIFELAVNKKASDVHIFVGKPPILRVDGELKLVKNTEELNAKDVENLIADILVPEQKEKFLIQKELDTSYELLDGNRLRVNCFFEKDNPGLVARIIPSKIPSMEDIVLPEIVYELTRRKRGLVLVTGPTGCGKSTTLAAMIDLINNERSVNIITLEDPIEFVFKPVKSIIKQRQVGTDTISFAAGLKHILRQDPNVIMVGEMRDLETIATTLTLAETGHLVFATLHTNNAAETIDRIIDVFPPYQQEQIRVQLSMVLAGVIAQQLVSKKDNGRIAAREVMIKNSAISNLIRESKTAQIRSVIQTSINEQMVSMDQDLQRLYKEKLIDKETADLYMVDGKVK